MYYYAFQIVSSYAWFDLARHTLEFLPMENFEHKLFGCSLTTVLGSTLGFTNLSPRIKTVSPFFPSVGLFCRGLFS